MRRASGKVSYTAPQYHNIVYNYEGSEEDWDMVQVRNSVEYGCSCSTGSNIVYPQEDNIKSMDIVGVLSKSYPKDNHGWCFIDQLPMTLQREISKIISSRRNFFPKVDIIDTLCYQTETWKKNVEETTWKEPEENITVPTIVRVWDEGREKKNSEGTRREDFAMIDDETTLMAVDYDSDEYSYGERSRRRRCITMPSVQYQASDRSPKRRMTVSSDQRIIYGMGKHFENLYSSDDSLANELQSLRMISDQEVDEMVNEEDIFISEKGSKTYSSTIVSLISSYVTFGLLKLYDALPLRSRHCRSG